MHALPGFGRIGNRPDPWAHLRKALQQPFGGIRRKIDELLPQPWRVMK
jgi:hypothetical protein